MHLAEPINQICSNFDVNYSWMAFSAAKASKGLQMSVNLSARPSVYLSVHLSVCLFVLCLSICHLFVQSKSKFNQSISLRAPTQWVIYLWYSYNFQLATNQILNSGCLSTRKNYLINLLLQFLNVKDISLSFM